ncbi:MAG: hypothetical protein BWY83_03108 [bacterium ADurb.Bin478]|nr:MAG: hypothetical protein BWY83_03108 [bacterium ADurb.Bin478]
MVVGHHLHEVIPILVTVKEMLQNLLAGKFEGTQPIQITAQIEQLDDVDDEIRIGIQQIAPLGLVKAQAVAGSGDGVLAGVRPARFHPAVPLDGVIAEITERPLVGFDIIIVRNGGGQQRDPLLM